MTEDRAIVCLDLPPSCSTFWTLPIPMTHSIANIVMFSLSQPPLCVQTHRGHCSEDDVFMMSILVSS
jgi:hypothetical protein